MIVTSSLSIRRPACDASRLIVAIASLASSDKIPNGSQPWQYFATRAKALGARAPSKIVDVVADRVSENF